MIVQFQSRFRFGDQSLNLKALSFAEFHFSLVERKTLCIGVDTAGISGCEVTRNALDLSAAGLRHNFELVERCLLQILRGELRACNRTDVLHLVNLAVCIARSKIDGVRLRTRHFVSGDDSLSLALCNRFCSRLRFGSSFFGLGFGK